MRFSILVAFLTALAFPAAAANAYDDPKSLVSAIYAPYQSGQKHDDVSQFYSSRLKQLFLDHAEAAAAQADTGAPLKATPAFDFNPFIDAQNALILDVAISEPLVVGDKALVTVGFNNFDQPTMLSLSLVRDADGWKVDDVTSMGGEENWMLSWLLRFDPWGVM